MGKYLASYAIAGQAGARASLDSRREVHSLKQTRSIFRGSTESGNHAHEGVSAEDQRPNVDWQNRRAELG